MESILKRKKINTGRQYNLDLLKSLAIVGMILCHTVTMLSGARADYESEFGYWFAEDVLGAYLAAAHAFMLCMGVGFVYSRKHTPRALVARGIRIYFLGYILNFFRGGMYAIVAGIFDPSYRDMIGYMLLLPDILQFAGLAMMLTAVFKKLKLDCRVILAISVVMSVISQLAAMKYQGITIANVLIGSFVPTTEDDSTFVLFGWYFFVAAGICFGEVLQRVKNLRRFYKRLLIVSGIIMIVYIAATVRYGCFFLSPGRIYYYTGILESIGLLSIDFVLMSLMYFGLNRLSPGQIELSKPLQICWQMSRNINRIYCAQWCIIGFLTVILVYLLELPLPYWVTYPMGVGIIILSYWAAELWVMWRSRKKRIVK